MSNSLQRLTAAIDSLEKVVMHKLATCEQKMEEADSSSLQQELAKLQEEHKTLQETSKEVINELNNSIQIIEKYFKKKDATN